MTITLTPQELETVYLALNNYSLSYIRMSRTWANLKPNGPDAAEQKANEIGQLQVKLGDLIFENSINPTL